MNQTENVTNREMSLAETNGAFRNNVISRILASRIADTVSSVPDAELDMKVEFEPITIEDLMRKYYNMSVDNVMDLFSDIEGSEYNDINISISDNMRSCYNKKELRSALYVAKGLDESWRKQAEGVISFGNLSCYDIKDIARYAEKMVSRWLNRSAIPFDYVHICYTVETDLVLDENHTVVGAVDRGAFRGWVELV